MLQIQRRGVAQVRQLPVVLQQYKTAFLEAMWMMMMMMMMMKKLVINEARMMVTSSVLHTDKISCSKAGDDIQGCFFYWSALKND